MCARVGNQQSRGVVIARLRSSVWSLLHQRRYLHLSTYLNLTEDREPTSHQRVPLCWLTGKHAHATSAALSITCAAPRNPGRRRK
jgi:hypothetical protein